jgi:hypothetical protein
VATLEGQQTFAQDRKVANLALSAAKPTNALITLEAPKTIVRAKLKLPLTSRLVTSADPLESPPSRRC